MRIPLASPIVCLVYGRAHTRRRCLLHGRDLITELNLTPGPEIGRLLHLIQENQAAGEIHTRDQALALARRAHS